jgi:hypothetical protein
METALLDSILGPRTGISVTRGRLVLPGREMFVDFLLSIEGDN